MNRYLVYVFFSLFLACSSRAEGTPEIYRSIRINEVFSKLIARDLDDRTYSGQIKSKTGLAEFEKAYGIKLSNRNLNFDTHFLIFGITDDFSSRAFQFLEQKKLGHFILDYVETGIKYKFRGLDKGKKYSFLQVFVLKRIEGISHIMIKNMVLHGVSNVFK